MHQLANDETRAAFEKELELAEKMRDGSLKAEEEYWKKVRAIREKYTLGKDPEAPDIDPDTIEGIDRDIEDGEAELARRKPLSPENLQERFADLVDSIFNNPKGIFDELKKMFFDIGKDLLLGMFGGMEAVKSFIVKGLNALLGGLIGNIQGILGIASPSKRMAKEIGEPMATGVLAGFTQAFQNVKANMNAEIGAFVTGANAGITNNSNTSNFTQNITLQGEPNSFLNINKQLKRFSKEVAYV